MCLKPLGVEGGRVSAFDGNVGSGPHMELVAAAVRLARRDLDDPRHSAGAKAFLRTEPFEGREPGIELDLFAELIGYGGSWEI